MEQVRVAAPSVLRGPSVSIDKDVKLHRLFERNEKSYPGHAAVVHEGKTCARSIYYELTVETMRFPKPKPKLGTIQWYERFKWLQ